MTPEMSNHMEKFSRAYWAAIHVMDMLRLQIWEERGLTLPQLRVLFIVRASPDVTTNTLAARLGITVSTVSGLVDKLVRAGLVERLTDPDDRRVIPLRLTTEGQTVAGQIGEKGNAIMEQIAATLGTDLQSVTGCLEQVVLAAAQAGLTAAAEADEMTT